jgi:hypothetical protein
VAQTFQSLHSKYWLRVKEKSQDLPIAKNQEDSDQREPLTLEKLSFSENKTMLESTLSPENSIEPQANTELKKHSTNHQRSKDLLLRRELEERSSTREVELMLGRRARKLTSLMKSSSPNILRKRRLPKRLLIQPQLQLLKKRRSQLQPSQPRRKNQRKPPSQPRKKNQRRLQHQLKKKNQRKLKERRRERNEYLLRSNDPTTF